MREAIALVLLLCCGIISGLTDYENECLEAHNEYRAKHGVPPLKWSDELAAGAQKWADHLAATNEPQHDIDSLISDGIGENINWVSPPEPSQCRETVEHWYSEAGNYDYNTGKSKAGKSILHFTQVIWKGTTELGMATASNDNRRFSVARYRPRGNSGDPPNYIDNVPRPQ